MPPSFANQIEKFRQIEPSAEVAGPCEPAMIEHVENLLGVRFPPSYKAFLLEHGALFSSVGAISGVFPQSPLAANAGTVLGDTLYYREHFQLLADFVVIERDFDDNDPWCLDLSAASSNGECPVVCYGLKGGASKRLYASFGDCFNEW